MHSFLISWPRPWSILLYYFYFLQSIFVNFQIFIISIIHNNKNGGQRSSIIFCKFSILPLNYLLSYKKQYTSIVHNGAWSLCFVRSWRWFPKNGNCDFALCVVSSLFFILIGFLGHQILCFFPGRIAPSWFFPFLCALFAFNFLPFLDKHGDPLWSLSYIWDRLITFPIIFYSKTIP